jgi:UDP-hydrolysing UDP-N-acetyl-D-glucosamine 2-epimerase
MIRLLSITSSRADVGILKPVWSALIETGRIELHVGITGMHCPNSDYVKSQIPKGAQTHQFGADIGGHYGSYVVQAMSQIQANSADLYARLRPDGILVTGDRMDMFPTAVAAIPFNIPIIHLHGGERTEGAMDDRLRHAMTKLSHLHCVSNADAAGRVCQMGEEASRIVITGAPGLDTMLMVDQIPRVDFFQELGLLDNGPLRLVTVHPETNSTDMLHAGKSVVEALTQTAGPPTIITAPNSDPGGNELMALMTGFCQQAPNTVFRATLGAHLYVNAMRHAAVMIGNSSSGIIEAPLFGLPVINVGNRQLGRLQGPNVRNCESDVPQIIDQLNEILAGHPNQNAASYPYGDGAAASRIANAILDQDDLESLLNKSFADDTAKFVNPW